MLLDEIGGLLPTRGVPRGVIGYHGNDVQVGPEASVVAMAELLADLHERNPEQVERRGQPCSRRVRPARAQAAVQVEPRQVPAVATIFVAANEEGGVTKSAS